MWDDIFKRWIDLLFWWVPRTEETRPERASESGQPSRRSCGRLGSRPSGTSQRRTRMIWLISSKPRCLSRRRGSAAGSRRPANGQRLEIEGRLRLKGRPSVATPGPVISRWRCQSACSPGPGGGGISGVIGGLLISGTSSSPSSREPSISGASGGRDGSLMIMGSPGGRPGAWAPSQA